MSEDNVEQTTFRRFVDKWVTPTTIAMMFGAIVWGLNLTNTQKNLIAVTAEHGVDIKYIYQEISKLRLTDGEQTLLLDQIAKRVERMHQADLKHFEEAEVWKRKIERNSDYVNRKRSDGG